MAMAAQNGFGRLMKQWRQQRGHSQLELSLRAEVSQKHISFMETGRSRPKEDTVHKVAEALEIPLRDRNHLYEMAGLAPQYVDVAISDQAVAPYKEALMRLLSQQDPYPAYVVDRWWNLVEANNAGRAIFMAPGVDTPNMVDAFMAPGMFRDMILNYNEVAWAFYRRLRSEAMQAPSDMKMQKLAERAVSYLADVPEPSGLNQHELAICPKFKIGDTVVNTVTMIAQFSEPNAIVLDELRLELVFPADDAAATFFQSIAAANVK